MAKKSNTKICILNCLELLSRDNKKDFLYGYLACWPFCYSKCNSLDVGSGIDFYNFQRFNEICSHYIGYHIQFYEEGIEAVQFLLNNALMDDKIVLLGLDAFFCPWNVAYQKQHICHFLIIYKWDRQERCYICADAFQSEDELFQLPESNIRQGYWNMRILEESPGKTMDLGVICEYLTQGYDRSFIERQFDDFIKNISFVNELGNLFNSKEIKTCTIVRKIRELSESRHEIAGILQRYERNNAEHTFGYLKKLFLEQEKKWAEINIILMKMFLSGKIKKIYMDRVIEQLEELKLLELDCFDKIQEMRVFMKGGE